MSGGRRFRDCPINLKEALLAKSRFSAYAASERLALAKARADKLVHHIASLFLMHESNAVVIYSQKLSEQIPRSYAAHAFNQFQRSMHLLRSFAFAQCGMGRATTEKAYSRSSPCLTNLS
jgi:hypothetical protein